jgi:uncharacterized protein (TIGR02421 family)
MNTVEAGTRLAAALEMVPEIVDRLEHGLRVRRTLAGGGRLHVDRPLPFLVAYRSPPDRADAGTRRLILGQPSYLAVRGDAESAGDLQSFVASVVEPLSRSLGAFLIAEVWSRVEAEPDEDHVEDPVVAMYQRGPLIRVVTPDPQGSLDAVPALIDALREISVDGPGATVEHVKSKTATPPAMEPIIDPADANELDCYVVGIEIEPVYRDADAGTIYPHVLRTVSHQLGDALRLAFYRFSHEKTSTRPESHHGLGRRAVVRAVHEVDSTLAAICDEFDFLLALTPVNTTEEWKTFRESKYRKEPTFRYRQLTHDPEQLLRRLYAVPLENVEDPTLERIYREKMREVARQLTMLAERNTHRFLYGSLQLYGEVEPSLLRLAVGILAGVAEDEPEIGRSVGARRFAKLAREFLDDLRVAYPELSATIELREDTSTLLVTKGRLLVPTDLRLSPERALALVHHEAGTHLLTWANGMAQPLALLHTGLAGYESLQEGLAVLSEFLVGGLNRSRLRLLAARVVAAAHVIDGASFSDIFEDLTRTHGVPARMAFTTTMRARRAGGLTKDIVYLQGLRELLDYIAGGGEVAILFLGKMALSHVPLVQELRARQVLSTPPLRPPCMDMPGAADKLQWLRDGRSVLDLPKSTFA